MIQDWKGSWILVIEGMGGQQGLLTQIAGQFSDWVVVTA